MSALLILVGLGIGILSGMLGIGGGVLLVPILVGFFDYQQKQAAGISLAVLSVPIFLPVVWQYYVQEMINKEHLRTAGWLAMGFAIGGIIGVSLLRHIPRSTLQLLFGLILIYVAARFLIAADADDEATAAAVGLGTVVLAWATFFSLRLLGRRYRVPSLGDAIREAVPQGPRDGDYYI
jgi:uncharacterized protein